MLRRAEFPGSVGCRPDNLSSLRLGLLFSPGFHLCCQEASYEGCNVFSMCVCVCVAASVKHVSLCMLKSLVSSMGSIASSNMHRLVCLMFQKDLQDHDVLLSYIAVTSSK